MSSVGQFRLHKNQYHISLCFLSWQPLVGLSDIFTFIQFILTNHVNSHWRKFSVPSPQFIAPEALKAVNKFEILMNLTGQFRSVCRFFIFFSFLFMQHEYYLLRWEEHNEGFNQNWLNFSNNMECFFRLVFENWLSKMEWVTAIFHYCQKKLCTLIIVLEVSNKTANTTKNDT